jgi:SAM-dependent methyltransferase
MTFSREWNNDSPRNTDSGMQGPMVLMLLNYVGDLRGQRLLELGCGRGLAARALIAAGADYHGIDGRQSAVTEASAIAGGRFACADFTHAQPFEGEFDIVIDRASVPHNDIDGVERCVGIIWKALKPGGLYFSSDWFSSHHSEAWRGEVVDAMTRTNYPDGQFREVGNVHFSSEKELVELFADFERVHLSERITRRPVRGGFLPAGDDMPWISPHYADKEYVSAVWDFVVRRPR